MDKVCESKEDAELAENVIQGWLNLRGLNLSEEKTKIVHITDGFDFLGFNIRQYKVSNTKSGYKLLIKPSKEFIRKTKCDIREIFLNHIGKNVNELINKINPVIRGKANYMKHQVSSKVFSYLDHYLYIRQFRYVKRTHPNKSQKWRKDKYWGNINLQKPNNKWVFGDKQIGSFMLQFSWFNIERHTLVRQRSSPDDPSQKEYWAKRNRKVDNLKAKRWNRKKEYVAHRQKYQCPICGQSLFNEEPLHLHHIVPRCKGGKDTAENLVWLHLYCHHKVHYQKVNTD